VRDAGLRHSAVRFDRQRVAPVQAQVHAESIARVVRNLLDNAAALASEVHVSTHGDGTQWIITVADNGPGIAVADRQRVFDRFTRLDAARSRSTGGSGLGLAIVRDLVTAHGGTIEVSTAPLGGAVFTVTVPRTPSTR
jgi:two-component system, OmpR family, sensor kinase